MAQITLYLDEKTRDLAKSAAAASGLSTSRWVAQIIRERISAEWPDDIKSLAGAWRDLPMAEELRASAGTDAPREQL